jgi:dTMP kinase
VQPDVTLYFRAPLEVALGRILDGRPELKYHEAGMDLGLSPDPYESFRIFQGRILEQYEMLAPRYHFTTLDATRDIHEQQAEVRRILRQKFRLSDFKKTKGRRAAA